MRYATLLTFSAILAGAASAAHAVGRIADVHVIDRDTGQRLPVHLHRGEYWVAGRPGAHYAIQIHSRDGRRLLAVTSVDGVNVLTGETAAHGQRGYVFEPWQGYDIAGWRKSDAEIAAFTFTSIPKSYAARTGRPQNAGVIGVALFRDQPPPPPPPQVSQRREADLAAKAEAASPLVVAPLPASGLGTGHGRREYSRVLQVPFDREQSTPNEVIRIRYDSSENLMAMGVIRRPPPAPRPRQVDPFPDSPRMGYVPDP